MEFHFSIPRLLLWVAFLAFFAWLGGFTPPSLPEDSLLDSHRVAKAWRYCVLLYLVGSVSASLIDHYVGNLDRSNLRLLYVLLGVALMAGSCLWLRGLRQASEQASASSTQPCLEARLAGIAITSIPRNA